MARGELITVGKKTMSVRDYADLVARTQMREMAKVAGVVRCQKNGVDHMKVSKHVMPKPDECTPWAGQVFYIGALPKDPDRFPSLRAIPNGGPPFHPFCRHVLVPYVVDFKAEAKIDEAREFAKKIPKRFYGKGASEVRKLVGDLTREEIDGMFPESSKSTVAAKVAHID